MQESQELLAWPRKVLFKLKSLGSDRPALTLNYLYYPIGHTHADYDYKNEAARKSYEAYVNKASQYLSKHFNAFENIILARNKPYIL